MLLNQILNKLFIDVITNDTRYALDGTKLAELGWVPPVDFDDALRETVEWTLEHPEWLEP